MRIRAEDLLACYRQGMFPMLHDDGKLYLHDPDPRGIFPLPGLAPRARTLRHLRAANYTYTFDRDFEGVMRACADRESTWIDEDMIRAYSELHALGHAWSVETWKEDALIGGMYGVVLGRAFFGESMFHRANNASTGAFWHMVSRLQREGFTLFDTQYINDHTRSFGAIEIPRDAFRSLLHQALADG